MPFVISTSSSGPLARQHRLSVLMYHHVGPRPSSISPLITMTSAVLERQMVWLAKGGYTAISAEHCLAWREGRATLPPKPVLLTFDDAYADLAAHALPVLERHGLSALVFVVTGLIGAVNRWERAQGDSTPLGLMSADDIRYWARRGIDFGGHSRTHPDLSTLGHSELEEEIRGSQSDLQELLDVPVSCFAYPYGRYNPAVRA